MIGSAVKGACRSTWSRAASSVLFKQSRRSYVSSPVEANVNVIDSPQKVIFSGIQPTGVPHLGNYLGAILPWVELQNGSSPSTKLLFSIVDLHSLTSHQPASARIESRTQLLAALLAAGLDPERCTIFFQSAVPAHAELHWILSCSASMPALSRMTQWKTKLNDQEANIEGTAKASAGQAAGRSRGHTPAGTPQPQKKRGAEPFAQSPNPKNEERLRLGLFSYPVLQAADVLIHKATHVPVGEDQKQHIEFARGMAQGFNRIYCQDEDGQSTGELLVVPSVVVSKAKRVMRLDYPQAKMSKSTGGEKSRIVLTDSDDDIRKKFRVAFTDSIDGIQYNRDWRPGVANLLEIVADLENVSPETVADDMKDSSLRVLKERAADLVVARFAPMREEVERLLGENDGRALDDIANAGAEKARASAEATMVEVRRAVGL